jgi:hypothetical protein
MVDRWKEERKKERLRERTDEREIMEVKKDRMKEKLKNFNLQRTNQSEALQYSEREGISVLWK